MAGLRLSARTRMSGRLPCGGASPPTAPRQLHGPSRAACRALTREVGHPPEWPAKPAPGHAGDAQRSGVMQWRAGPEPWAVPQAAGGCFVGLAAGWILRRHIGRKFRCALERLRCASLGNVVVVCALERLAQYVPQKKLEVLSTRGVRLTSVRPERQVLPTAPRRGRQRPQEHAGPSEVQQEQEATPPQCHEPASGRAAHGGV